MNNRERELMAMMRNPCFYLTLKEHIHEFLASYNRLKILEKVYPIQQEHKIELKYFYDKYIELRAFKNLYDFCVLDRKIRKEGELKNE